MTETRRLLSASTADFQATPSTTTKPKMMTSGNTPTSKPAVQTVPQFCLDNAISQNTYYKLRKAGLGPAEMRLGSAVRISQTAAEEWRRARENPAGTEAETVQHMAAKLRRRALGAVKKSVASPRHPSKRPRNKSTK